MVLRMGQPREMKRALARRGEGRCRAERLSVSCFEGESEREAGRCCERRPDDRLLGRRHEGGRDKQGSGIGAL